MQLSNYLVESSDKEQSDWRPQHADIASYHHREGGYSREFSKECPLELTMIASDKFYTLADTPNYAKKVI